MNFNSDSKVKDIAISHPAARHALEDAGVDYCCGGGKSLHEACLHAGVEPEEVLNRLRENAKQARQEEVSSEWELLRDLTRHIREKHHRYVREAIPCVRGLLEKVKARHGQNHPEIMRIESLFHEVAREMIMHMQKEEQILFPYIDALEKSVESGEALEPPFFQSVRNPIQVMMREHDAAGDLVKQIRSASGDYVPPDDACASFKTLYEELKQFEADLHLHVHLENNILFPRAVEMEGAVV